MRLRMDLSRGVRDWGKKREAYLTERLAKGEHPDTHPKFWADFRGDPMKAPLPVTEKPQPKLESASTAGEPASLAPAPHRSSSVTPEPGPRGCGCRVGDESRTPNFPALLMLLALVRRMRTRKEPQRRAGSRRRQVGSGTTVPVGRPPPPPA